MSQTPFLQSQNLIPEPDLNRSVGSCLAWAWKLLDKNGPECHRNPEHLSEKRPSPALAGSSALISILLISSD